MESPEDIEKALAALVPSAISEKGQRSLDDLIDNLAAGNAPLVEMEMPAPRRQLPWGWVGGLGVGAAAALALAFQIPSGPRSGSDGPVSGPVAGLSNPVDGGDEAGLIPLGRPELIDSVVPALANSGMPRREARVRYVQERLRDVKTGCEVVVTSRPESPLGITLGGLNEATRAHLPELPHGLGMVVTAVDPDAAYAKAGIKSFDVLWKLGDQFITSKPQFITLLQLHKEGEEVKFSLYRSGKTLEIPVVLGAFPEELREPSVAMVPAGAKDGVRDVPMMVLRPEDAETETPEGKVTLWQTAGVSEVKILSHSGAVIYEGLLVDNAGKSLVPESWRAPVSALESVYIHKMKQNTLSPRVRRAIAEQDAGDK